MTMRTTLTFVVVLGLCVTSSHADPTGCHLPQVARDSAAQLPLSADGELRAFFDRVNDISTRRDPGQVKKCCASANAPVATAAVCSFATFVASGKKPEVLLKGTPFGKAEVQWLWRWDEVVQRTGGGTFQDGFAAAYIDALFGTIDKTPTAAFEKLFALYRYADGEYAQYFADRLVTVIENQPKTVLGAWSGVGKHGALVERAIELYPEHRNTIANAYRQACANDSGQVCAEAMRLFASSKS